MADAFTTRGTAAVPDGTMASGVTPAQLSAEIRLAARAQIVLADKVIRKDLPRGVAQWKYVSNSSLTATSLTEEADQDSSAMTLSGITVTTDGVGVTVKPTEAAQRATTYDLAQLAVTEGSRALAEKMDTDLLALASGFTTNSVGTSGGDLTKAIMMSARYKLLNANVPRGFDQGDPSSFGPSPSGLQGIMCVLDPWALLDLQTAVETSGSSWLMDPTAHGVMYDGGAVSPGYAGSFAGIPFFQSNMVQLSGHDFINLMFVPSALLLAVQDFAVVRFDFDIETRTDVITVDAWYGVSEGVDAFACKITVANA